MKFFSYGKDGGPKSTVSGYWLAEIKSLFSIVLLRFDDGSRDEYHNHAFNSLNWLLSGEVLEQDLDGTERLWISGWLPILTKRSTFHRVQSHGTTWVLSLRGPWSKTWMEWNPKTSKFTTLTHGRVEV